MSAIDRIRVHSDTSIHETMRSIDAGSVELAVVVDGEGGVLGTVSDGDIRRALLGGASLADPVDAHVQRDFTWVGPGTARADVLDLMRARFINQVPVLDDGGRLVGLHVMREILGATERDNVAVIMAGGRGSRLGPLTDALPKPMMPVAGRPILERIILHLVGYGFRRVYIAVNYLADVIIEHLGDGSAFGCKIAYLEEDPDRPLGTGGALGLLPRAAVAGGIPLLVMNADLVTQFDVERLMRAHEEGGRLLTMGLKELALEVPYGVVTVDGSLVARIEEKPRQVWIVNAGVYVLDPGLVSGIPRDSRYAMTELVADCLAKGDKVGGHLLEGDWLDVGRIEELRRARGEG